MYRTNWQFQFAVQNKDKQDMKRQKTTAQIINIISLYFKGYKTKQWSTI